MIIQFRSIKFLQLSSNIRPQLAKTGAEIGPAGSRLLAQQAKVGAFVSAPASTLIASQRAPFARQLDYAPRQAGHSSRRGWLLRARARSRERPACAIVTRAAGALASRRVCPLGKLAPNNSAH